MVGKDPDEIVQQILADRGMSTEACQERVTSSEAYSEHSVSSEACPPFSTLLHYDQLRGVLTNKEALYGFEEEEITFPPTYRIGAF